MYGGTKITMYIFVFPVSNNLSFKIILKTHNYKMLEFLFSMTLKLILSYLSFFLAAKKKEAQETRISILSTWFGTVFKFFTYNIIESCAFLSFANGVACDGCINEFSISNDIETSLSATSLHLIDHYSATRFHHLAEFLEIIEIVFLRA